MKNHFLFPYAGNKRNEVENIYDVLDLKNITTIIEPFCGSASMSFYIASKNPKRFKYVLNDNDANLMRLYNILKDEKAIDELEKMINEKIDKFNSFQNDKDRKFWYEENKKDGFTGWLFSKKYHSIREGLYPPISRTEKIKPFIVRTSPIYHFMRDEDVELYKEDAIEIIKRYKDDDTNLFLIDPPYVSTCNLLYNNPNLSIYEWLSVHNINAWKSSVYFILENIWINKLLFSSNQVITEYNKQYSWSNKKTSHIIITKK
jgi:site-specific DNA-adenine methylase